MNIHEKYLKEKSISTLISRSFKKESCLFPDYDYVVDKRMFLFVGRKEFGQYLNLLFGDNNTISKINNVVYSKKKK